MRWPRWHALLTKYIKLPHAGMNTCRGLARVPARYARACVPQPEIICELGARALSLIPLPARFAGHAAWPHCLTPGKHRLRQNNAETNT